MKITRELISPTIAKKLLELNTANFRKMDAGIVRKYCRDMLAGDWAENGDPIQFGPDVNGIEVLKNGQHRLQAIVDSGTSQWMVVIRGVVADGKYMDRGKSRTGASYLAYAGLPEAEGCWTVAKMCIAYNNGWWNLTSIPLHHISDAQIHQFIEGHTEELVQAVRLCKSVKSMVALSITGTVAFFGAANHRPMDSELMKWFMEKLRTGEGLNSEQPLLHLRHMILQRSAATKLKQCVKRAYVTMAWNRTVVNEPTTKLYLRLTGPNPQSFPSEILNECDV